MGADMAEQQSGAGCCGASRKSAGAGPGAAYLDAARAVAPAPEAEQAALLNALVPIPGGIFEMGARRSRFPADLDSPRRKVRVAPFLISATAVTTSEYARFAAATGYRTVAEQEGWSYVFHLLLPDPTAWPQHPPGLPWWRRVNGACWSAPEGPGSTFAGREDHPAVHIAWYDAVAYCTWAGLRLPSEAPWERAARGGLAKRKFPWGDEMMPNGARAMNTFQGRFPHHADAGATWTGSLPVGSFAPNGYGLYNMTGNVWEWTNDSFGPLPEPVRLPPRDPARDPLAAEPAAPRVQRGGSYLCHDSYCDRYHVHSRTRNDPESSTGNLGFRVAG